MKGTDRPVEPGRFIVAANLLLAIGTGAILISVVPVFAAMFADFGAKLPWPTVLLLRYGDFQKHWAWLADPRLLLLFGPGVLLAHSGEAQRRWQRVMLLAQLVLLLLFLVAMLLPIFQLAEVAGSPDPGPAH